MFRLKPVWLGSVLSLWLLTRSVFGVTDNIMAQYRVNQAKIKTFQATYSQTISSPLLAGVQTETGKLFRVGNLFRKNMSTPFEKIIIFSEQDYYEKNERNGAVINAKLDPIKRKNLWMSISPDALLPYCQLSLKTEYWDMYEMEGDYAGIKVIAEIMKSNGLPRKMILTEKGKSVLVVMPMYESIQDAFVLKTLDSTLTLGSKDADKKELKSHIEYKDIRLNEVLSPTQFDY